MADDTSLLEIEPSPIDETPPSFRTSKTEKSYFPPTPASTASTRGLHSSSPSHGLLYYLTRTHRYSTYAFTAFAAAHISNTSLLPLLTRSVPAAEPYLLLTRPYYQGIPFEPLLIIVPAYAHVLSGLAIRLYRRNLAAKRYGDEEEDGEESEDGGGGRAAGIRSLLRSRYWPVVSGTSQLGYALVPLLAVHVAVNRLIPAGHPGGSSNVNLGYVAHGFARFPLVSWVGYAALVGVASGHFVWGWARWGGWTPGQMRGEEASGGRDRGRNRRWYGINAVVVAVAAVWMAGGLGVVGRAGAAGGWVGKLYDEMLKQVPFVGRWL